MEQNINLISAAWSGCHWDGAGKTIQINGMAVKLVFVGKRCLY